MFSIIVSMDSNRLEQFKETKRVYDTFPQKKEFLIPTRTYDEVYPYLKEHKLLKNVRLLPYTIESGFNCSKALNMGVRKAKYDQIIITCPEVKPTTEVLSQLEELIGQNVVCQVFDTDINGNITMSLVNTGFRQETPGMYFLAMFNKKDIEKINGWDEEFMKGYAYEDTDFGSRWSKAELPFIVRDDIQGVHQYHPRGEATHGWGDGALQTNYDRFHTNNVNGVIYCENGLNKGDPGL